MAPSPEWPMVIYWIMTSISLPLYVLVLVVLLRLRRCLITYRNTFYTIMLQHCIADILAMTVFTIIWCMRMISLFHEFYFGNQKYGFPAATYNSIYYFLYIRCCGIIFLSVHRFVIIQYHSHRITRIIQDAASWKIITTYWMVPTLISIVVLKDFDFYYDSFETMEVVAPRDVITRNTLMAFIVVFLTCFICSLSYLLLFFFLKKSSKNVTRSLRREVHIAIQVLALLCAFFVMLAYYGLQNYFSQTQNSMDA